MTDTEQRRRVQAAAEAAVMMTKHLLQFQCRETATQPATKPGAMEIADAVKDCVSLLGLTYGDERHSVENAAISAVILFYDELNVGVTKHGETN